MISLDKDQGNHLYKQTFEVVRECVLRADWLGVSQDCPYDEFDGEVARIVGVLLRNPRPTEEELASAIATIYAQFFGGKAEGTSKYFRHLAAGILQQTKHLYP